MCPASITLMRDEGNMTAKSGDCWGRVDLDQVAALENPYSRNASGNSVHAECRME